MGRRTFVCSFGTGRTFVRPYPVKNMKMNRIVTSLMVLFLVSFFAEQAITAQDQPGKEKPHILYIVDGKPMPAKDVDKLDFQLIEQIEYVKEKEKIRKYTEDEAIETVVLMKMKKPEAEEADTLQ